ncbi:7725_t:CDS:2 [Entrophospora sp. SA101]|nr:7725_t:CDS:2 [Entrophospora sp. SA101]
MNIDDGKNPASDAGKKEIGDDNICKKLSSWNGPYKPLVNYISFSILDRNHHVLYTPRIFEDSNNWLEKIYKNVNTSILHRHTYPQLLELTSDWKPYLHSESSELTVISIIDKLENIKPQLDSILSQSTRPENVIIVTSKSIVNEISQLLEDNHIDFIMSIHVMNTSDKLKLLGWLQLTQHIKTTNVLFLDSGVILGEEFIQNMLRVASTNEYGNALLGTMGAYIKVDGGLNMNNNEKSLVCLTENNNNDHYYQELTLSDPVTSSQKVDMLTNIWFFKRQWISTLFQEQGRLDVMLNGLPFGFYFTYALKYHENVPSYILPIHNSDKKTWGDSNLIQLDTCKNLQSALKNNVPWNNLVDHGYPLVLKESLVKKNIGLNRLLFVIDGEYQEKMFRPLFCSLSTIKNNLVNVVVTGNSRGISALKLKSTLLKNNYYSKCKNLEIYDLDIKTVSYNDDIGLKIKVFHGVSRIIQFIEPEVVIYSKIEIEESKVVHGITLAVNKFKNITKIQLPLDEIHYAVEIMTDLPFESLKIQILTQNRADSLMRLLTSLDSSIYFGEDVPLTINMDRGADNLTIELSNTFKWGHGMKNIRHRVVQGGLLPAVVEAYYPYDYNDYALILEDDIELSPFHYLWSKYAILKYRYGPDRAYSKRLYGLSLYNQKNMELPLPGRKKFFPELVLENTKYDIRSPYLCQVPCSWGAVYFPEIWREFHEYLIARLDDLNTYNLQNIEVPYSRSNRWKKSWKRFLIELAYLRGYVMLYPNFSNFTSFSTNHAEFGEHIHFRENKPDPGSIFGVPLMRENIIFQELPDGQLANYNALPVMDLWGDLVTFDGLLRRGHHLQSNVSLCSPPDKDDDPTFDPSDLLCINPIEKRKALAESQKYKRDLNIMLRVFQEVKDFAEKNEKNMGPRKFIRTFLKILNGTFVPPPIIFNDRNDSNYILTDVDQYDDNKLIAGSNGGFNQDISNSLLVDGGNALTQAVNNNILTEANTNTTIMDEDNQIAQKVETKYKEQIKPLRIYEEISINYLK